MPKSRYKNIEVAQQDTVRRNASWEPSLAPAQEHVKADKSHISQLIVTGRGYEAVKALDSVKERVDENTAVCLLNDGMGVLEHAQEHIFKDTEKAPGFILGHMSHALAYNRNRKSVKELKTGRMVLTQVEDGTGREATPNEMLLEYINQGKALRATAGTFENWMRFKLPSMVFTAAVEPVCVLLEIPYKALLENKSAQSMIYRLLDEIVTVVDHMDELQNAQDLKKFIHDGALKKWCFQRIMGKASAPCDLLKRVEKGWQTDIRYQNGFFRKRGKLLGIDMPLNDFMIQMVEARRLEAMAKMDSWVRVEEKSMERLDGRADQSTRN